MNQQELIMASFVVFLLLVVAFNDAKGVDTIIHAVVWLVILVCTGVILVHLIVTPISASLNNGKRILAEEQQDIEMATHEHVIAVKDEGVSVNFPVLRIVRALFANGDESVYYLNPFTKQVTMYTGSEE